MIDNQMTDLEWGNLFIFASFAKATRVRAIGKLFD
jgi:hypothetical protein